MLLVYSQIKIFNYTRYMVFNVLNVDELLLYNIYS